ncbi:HECT and RLD domain containing E3 ubiquitin ligase 4 isoform X2 [Oratosquilla oratoria]|uniref:HECT and RLD domain containing E3 ubiquitin ligase 4 isoform X2 n=1 Tax=Oratosquilla oratoria TaxID=337810 RepID=UPI003F75EA9E
MFCWGSTANGELGLGAQEEEQVILPRFNNFQDTWNICEVAAGLTHTLFLNEEGHVYSCGSNEHGQLGRTGLTTRPALVESLEDFCVTSVAVGDEHSVALTKWGLIYTWGGNGFGQLGLNSYEAQEHSAKLVKTIAQKQVIQIACGSHHVLALTRDGELYAWGLNNHGQLGLGQQGKHILLPTQVKVVVGCPVVQVAAGGQHSAITTQAGFLLTWGSNKYGQLGVSPEIKATSFRPLLVPNLATYSEAVRYVSCGGNHTAVLDSNGKVWTFGHGRYGELGHGSYTSSCIPRTVLDLVGSKVTQVACGLYHTVVYIPSQVYCFGQGLSGQLGIVTPRNSNVPQVVAGPWLSPRGVSVLGQREEQEEQYYVRQVFAGGNTCFVKSCRDQEERFPDFCLQSQLVRPLIVQPEKIDEMLGVGEEDMIDDDLFCYMETVFSALSCWSQSFLSKESTKHQHGIDFGLAEDCIAKLGRIARESMSQVIHQGMQKCLKDLHAAPASPESLRPFLLLPLYKHFMNIENIKVFQLPYASAFLNLDGPNNSVLRKWVNKLPGDFMKHLIDVYKKVVLFYLTNLQKIEREREEEVVEVMKSSLHMLKWLHIQNTKHRPKIAQLQYQCFYIPEITEKINLRDDYLVWVEVCKRGVCKEKKQILFCEFPFLFDAAAKTLLLRIDATRLMQGAIQEEVWRAGPLSVMLNPSMQFLNLVVSREDIVGTTLAEITSKDFHDLKKPLKVTFIGEEAEDAGGVRKEFFLLLLREILNPNYGMFVHFSETNTIWFREEPLENDAMYNLIGIICGLAIYNTTIINLPFPLALYKKLLGESVCLDDLGEMDPHVARGIQELLDYDGADLEDVFCLNFTVTQDFFGQSKVIELKKNGENCPVTTENRQEYADLYVDYKLNKSIEKQYRKFHDGFHRVCGSEIVKLFFPLELMALVTGNEDYDWKEFQQNTEYKGEYYADHATIKLFWEVFHDLNLFQKKQFLLFLTGTDRIPILGMKTIKLVIQPTADTNYLPVAHTCVAQLDLPKYNTKEKLRYKLLQAIQQAEGFGLV